MNFSVFAENNNNNNNKVKTKPLELYELAGKNLPTVLCNIIFT
jgi:hypothetical protein